MKVSCPRCGKDNPDDIRFCLGCGSEIQPRSGAGARAGGPPKIAAPPPLGMPRPPQPSGGPIAPPPAVNGPPAFNGPPPLAPPVPTAAPAATGGPPMLGPLPPLGSSAGTPPAILGGGAPSALGPLPPLGGGIAGAPPPVMPPSIGGAPPPIAPPSLGGLPPIGARPVAPIAPPVAPPAPAASPLGGLGALGPLPPIGAPAPPPVAQPPLGGGGLGPLPPLAAPSATPAFTGQSSAAIPSVGMGSSPALGPLPPLGAPPAPPPPSGLGPLPPLGAAPQQSLGGGGLGGLPPLNRPPSGIGSGPYQAAQPASADPFASGDPFASSDPFASAPVQPPVAPMAQSPYGATAEPFPPPQDPFTQSASAPVSPRAATIGPGGAIGVPGFPPLRGPTPPSPSPRMGTIGPSPGVGPRSSSVDPWGAQPIEPEIEESQTRVVQALGAARPKFLVTQLDGTEEGEFPLNEGENLIGREVGGMFAKDNLLSGRHATIIVQGQSVWVRDEGSRNGVYARIARQQHVELQDGDQFCIGRIILRYEFQPAVDSVGLLHLVVGRDVDKALFPFRIPRAGMTLGRNRADLRFPMDGWVSGLHCQIVVHGPQVMIVDLGSSNGTYLRIRNVRALTHHDALLMGQRIFHLHFP